MRCGAVFPVIIMPPSISSIILSSYLVHGEEDSESWFLAFHAHFLLANLDIVPAYSLSLVGRVFYNVRGESGGVKVVSLAFTQGGEEERIDYETRAFLRRKRIARRGERKQQ